MISDELQEKINEKYKEILIIIKEETSKNGLLLDDFVTLMTNLACTLIGYTADKYYRMTNKNDLNKYINTVMDCIIEVRNNIEK